MSSSNRDGRIAEEVSFRDWQRFGKRKNAFKPGLHLGSNLLDNVAHRREAREEKSSMKSFLPDNAHSSGEIRSVGNIRRVVRLASSLNIEQGARVSMLIVRMVKPDKRIKRRVARRRGKRCRKVTSHGGAVGNTKNREVLKRKVA